MISVVLMPILYSKGMSPRVSSTSTVTTVNKLEAKKLTDGYSMQDIVRQVTRHHSSCPNVPKSILFRTQTVDYTEFPMF